MAYYTALQTAWNGAPQPPAGVTGTALTGGMTTAQKLAAVNAWITAGPNVNVDVSAVVGKLMLTQAYFPLLAFSQGAGTGNPTHDAALLSAKTLMTLISIPNAPVFQMSDAATYATVRGMMDAILAQESAAPGTAGFTQAVHDALLALCATTAPWWQANSYPRAFDLGDVAAAGLS